jgi:hypothetical protein
MNCMKFEQVAGAEQALCANTVPGLERQDLVAQQEEAGRAPSNLGATLRNMTLLALAVSCGWAQAGTAHASDDGKSNKAIKSMLAKLRAMPHVYPPQAIAAGDHPAQVVQYVLLDNKNFQPNVFTSKIPGINDTAPPTAGDSETVGLARMVVLQHPGLPTDPNDPRTHIGIYLDISGLQPALAEVGVYEATLLYNTQIPPVAPPRPNGEAQYGTMTAEDALVMAARGSGNNVPGNIFTLDGNAPRFPSPADVWPDKTSNVVTWPVNAGTFNALQETDAHAFWELKPATSMVFPHQEFPFVGGVPAFYPPLGPFEAGVLGHTFSIVPGSGPSGISNDPRIYGDNPDDPRDPDRSRATDPSQLEFRLRSVPSGLTEEIHRDIFIRRASFEPNVTNLQQRLNDAVAKEVALIDTNNDGVLSFDEIDIDGTSDNLPNTRLYVPVTAFSRYVVQKEINDGLIAPRFANSQRAWVLSGFLQPVTHAGHEKKTPDGKQY